MKIFFNSIVLLVCFIGGHLKAQLLLEALEGEGLPKCISLNNGYNYYTYVKYNGKNYNPVTYHKKMKDGTLPNGEFEVGLLLPTTEKYTCPKGKIAVKERESSGCWFMTLINTDAVLATPGSPPFGWYAGPKPKNVVHISKTYICTK